MLWGGVEALGGRRGKIKFRSTQLAASSSLVFITVRAAIASRYISTPLQHIFSYPPFPVPLKCLCLPIHLYLTHAVLFSLNNNKKKTE